MKKYFNNNHRKNKFSLYLILPGLAILTIFSVTAQEGNIFSEDYLMPRNGKSKLTISSGIPYVALGEYSYGLSQRFSIGVLYGYTPDVVGYGLSIKTILAQPSPSLRLYLKTPMIYYPRINSLGGDPWLLAWPSLNLEWKLQNGSRLWTGMGVVGASCAGLLFGSEEKENTLPGSDMGKNQFMSGLWNTIQFGYNKHVSSKLSVLIEASPVFKGFRLDTKDWIGGPPVILILGVSYTF